MKATSLALVAVLVGLVLSVLLLAGVVRRHAMPLAAEIDRTPGTRPEILSPDRSFPDELAREARFGPDRPHRIEELPTFVAGLDARTILDTLRRAVDEAEEAEIQAKLQTLAAIDEEELRRRGLDTRRFAHALLEAAVRGTVLDPGRGPDSAADEILFSSSPDGSGGPLRPTRAFAPTDLRIVAWIPSDRLDPRAGRALVKWLDRTRGRIERLGVVAAGPDRGSGLRPVALRKPDGWSPGRYEVEVLSFDEAVVPLAAGAFRVDLAALEANGTTSSLELFLEDPEERSTAPVDAVSGTTERIFLATRVAVGDAFRGGVVLRDEDSPGSESFHDFRPARAGSVWRVAEVTLPLTRAVRIVTAELRLGGETLEILRFPVLDRDVH